jgi:hypothetical protein
MTSANTSYFIGLDLAQPNEFTALAVLERPSVPHQDSYTRRDPVYALRHLQRFPLGTAYPEVIRCIRDLLRTQALHGSVLVVDQTGVGRAVVNMVAAGLKGGVDCLFVPATISAGQDVTLGTTGRLFVPKKELIGTLQVLLQTRRLQIARSLPDAALLLKELENFRMKVNVARDDTLEAWREGRHDDLIFAVALAAWVGQLAIPDAKGQRMMNRSA